MRDLHCHILPGVDDGARSLDESLRMFEAARKCGITSITCTPHCRDPYFDYMRMWKAYYAFERAVRLRAPDFELQMGFEVSHAKLKELGLGWAERLHFDGTNEFLLELDVGASRTTFADYERTIFALQGMGLEVIIAHPERYRAIQKDVGIAEELCQMGCRLQASADFVRGGRLGRERRPARALIRRGLYTYIASDAHHVGHYSDFTKVCAKWGSAFDNV